MKIKNRLKNLFFFEMINKKSRFLLLDILIWKKQKEKEFFFDLYLNLC